MVKFSLHYNNGAEKFVLPVNPSELSITSGSQNSTINVSGLGEVTIMQDPVLKTFEFSSFFPAVWGPYCNYEKIDDPWKSYWMLERWRRSGNPIRLIVSGTPINYAVTIEDFSINEQGGDVDTLYYDMSLKEYRFVRPRKLKPLNGNSGVAVNQTDTRPDSRNTPDKYVVKKGDSLWKIAQNFLEDGSRYKEIASLNGLKLPYTIYPGDVLKLPKR